MASCLSSPTFVDSSGESVHSSDENLSCGYSSDEYPEYEINLCNKMNRCNILRESPEISYPNTPDYDIVRFPNKANVPDEEWAWEKNKEFRRKLHNMIVNFPTKFIMNVDLKRLALARSVPFG